jgi:hypothetical protein
MLLEARRIATGRRQVEATPPSAGAPDLSDEEIARKHAEAKARLLAENGPSNAPPVTPGVY